MRPHFAHRAGTTCSPETYLHKAGKVLFAETFLRCVADGIPFEIVLHHPIVCRRFEEYIGKACVQRRHEEKTYDLTNYFNQVRIEQRDGKFIPDLLLFNEEATENRVYVEIAVTHFLSENKLASPERIIEIPVRSEDDFEMIRQRRLTPDECRFVNFISESQFLPDSACTCHSRLAYGFFVYDSGRCVLDTKTVANLVAKRQRNNKKIVYFRLLFPSNVVHQDFLPCPGDVFRSAVNQACKEGLSLRNCYLCRYQGDNFAGIADSPVYCKYLKKRCNSNEAVSCHAFRRRKDIA